MLRRPGSTTIISLSTAWAVALPRCSIPASISSTTTSSLARTMCITRAFKSVLSGHMHPPPPFGTPPRRIILMLPILTESASGRSSTLGLSLKKPPMVPGFAPVLSKIRSFISEMGVIFSESEMPRAAAKFASGSASIARTCFPCSSRVRAKRAAKVVLPTPPLPLIASFICISFLFIAELDELSI